jgi:hypothetical protein
MSGVGHTPRRTDRANPGFITRTAILIRAVDTWGLADQDHRVETEGLYDPHIWKQVGGTMESLEASRQLLLLLLLSQKLLVSSAGKNWLYSCLLFRKLEDKTDMWDFTSWSPNSIRSEMSDYFELNDKPMPIGLMTRREEWSMFYNNENWPTKKCNDCTLILKMYIDLVEWVQNFCIIYKFDNFLN